MHRKAFTIVELLVVITIIAILTGIVAFNVTSIRQNSRDAKRVSDILQIGKSLDTYAQVNRDFYPRNASNSANSAYVSNDSRMCADSADLDINTFPGKAIPKDASPALRGTNCTDMRYGYIYHTRYTSVTASLANTLGTQYVLEVGLEGKKPKDESSLKTPSDEKLANPTVGINDPTSTSSGKRYRYFLVGPYCGTGLACNKY